MVGITENFLLSRDLEVGMVAKIGPVLDLQLRVVSGWKSEFVVFVIAVSNF